MRNQIPGGGSSPSGLPLGLAPGSGIPRATGLNGATEGTGQAAALIGAILNAGGQKPGHSGPRGVEKPSLARANALSRRLGGNPPHGKELKGL